MRTYTDGPIFVRGLTVAEKQAGWDAAKELGLPSLSSLSCFLLRQHLAQRHGTGRPAKILANDVTKTGASRIARKVGQWATPAEAAAEKKNSSGSRPRNNSPAAVRVSTTPEA